MVIIILLATAFVTAISGKPLDGALLGAVAMSLAWDAWRRPAAATGPRPQPPAQAPASRRRGAALALAGLAGAAVYVAVVSSFSRYSWPATIAVMAVGTAAVVAGWRGPRRRRPDPGALPVRGAALWGGVFVAGCLWELAALLGQPTLTTGSYWHPTVSTLADPVLASSPGRSVMLAAWLALGWFLIRR